MKKLASIAAAIVVAPMLLVSTPVFADSPGQLSNAPTNYEVKNVTKGGSYSQATSAACGETVRYSTLVANSDFGTVENISIKTGLKTGDVNVSGTNTVGDTTSVSGKVTVTTTGNLEVVPGTTKRVNVDKDTQEVTNTVVLADGTTSSNVYTYAIGDLSGSTQMFGQFDAKVKCDKPQECKPGIPVGDVRCNPEECKPGIPKGDKRCDTTTTVTSTPTELTKTGPGEVAALFAAAVAIGTAAYAFVLRRQNAR